MSKIIWKKSRDLNDMLYLTAMVSRKHNQIYYLQQDM